MLKFKKVELSDKPWVERLIFAEDLRSADFNFTNIFVWDESLKQSIAQFANKLIIRFDKKDFPYYAFPVGSGDLKSSISAIIEDSRKYRSDLHICGVLREHMDLMETLFPRKFKFVPVEKFWDYLYSIEKLKTLSGKKLHGKRNHINRFIANNNWSFEPVGQENIRECLDMDLEWMKGNTDGLGYEYRYERIALEKAMNNFDYLGLDGGLIRSSGRLVAFAVGERLNSDTYVIHFEKAFSEIKGLYAMINREFARYISKLYPKILYINREDDMGLESLRISKGSYYPDSMVEKYSAYCIVD